MLLKFLPIFLCYQLINAYTEVKQCKSAPKTEGQFADCVAPPCNLVRGGNTTIESVFTAEDNFDAIVANVYATVMGMKHPYPGIDGIDGCNSLYLMPDRTKASCPVEKGKTYLYEIILPVKRTFPKISALGHFAAKDKSSGRLASCFEINFKVV